jgi:hypothetical protein
VQKPEENATRSSVQWDAAHAGNLIILALAASVLALVRQLAVLRTPELQAFIQYSHEHYAKDYHPEHFLSNEEQSMNSAL